MQKLSVALATYNEEENISRCLNSVLGLASEVVIVDGESTDRTQELAKSLGAQVITKPNQKNFHINKQIAIDSCKFDWILQLDADEVVSGELKREIEQILKEDTLVGSQNKKELPDGYFLPRKNWFLGRFLMKGGQYPDYTLRLYRKGKGRLPQKDVHEQAVVDGKVEYAKEALLHYPYKNFHAYIAKWSRYNHFEAGLLRERLQSVSMVRKIGVFFEYTLIKPILWFFMSYGRHKGFMDGWQGFVFSFYSAIRFPATYILYLENRI